MPRISSFLKRYKWYIIGGIVVVGVIVYLTDTFGVSGPPVQ